MGSISTFVPNAVVLPDGYARIEKMLIKTTRPSDYAHHSGRLFTTPTMDTFIGTQTKIWQLPQPCIQWLLL
jgi:hypothetical protein